MFCYAFGLGWVLPNAMAGAIGPFPRMAGLAAAGAGFVQLTGSALYAIAVSRTYDGTLRPMTTAVATAGGGAIVTIAIMGRGGPLRHKQRVEILIREIPPPPPHTLPPPTRTRLKPAKKRGMV